MESPYDPGNDKVPGFDEWGCDDGKGGSGRPDDDETDLVGLRTVEPSGEGFCGSFGWVFGWRRGAKGADGE